MVNVDLADSPELLVFAGIVVIVAALVMAMILFWAIRQPPPAAVVSALTMLTLFAIAGGMATSNDEAWAIAAAGVGALAGSVTSYFGHYRPEDVEKAVAVVQELERQAPQVEEDGRP